MTTGEGLTSVSSLWAHDADLSEKIKEQEHHRRHARGVRLLLLALSTLGVVYGDIGTSPLYVYGAVFPDGAPEDVNKIYGVFSTIFWTITAVVLVKYVIFTMSADDNGEGGIFALYALICRAANIRHGSRMHEADLSLTQYQEGRVARGSRVAAKLRAKLEHSRVLQTVLLVVVLLASNMVISDGVLTPAISVVSAIEGIQFQTGISNGTVMGISMGILVALFAMQSFGTQKVSFLFSPLMLLWFIVNATLGIYNICRFGPDVFKALSPHYMYYFWSGNASQAWRDLGNIMLCVTGAEALYADMGHFNALSIRLSFLSVVYPSLIFTYLGQTAMIASNPARAAAAYWQSVPDSVLWPIVVLATLAAIIASQALITGAFSIVQQAMAMNAFPRLTVKHTSDHIMGQVYIPEVNWLLMVGALLVVGVFQTSAKIGNAYGLAVIVVMTLDTSLLAIVMVAAWEWHLAGVAAFWLVFNFITGAYLSSNVSKVPKGAWFSLALSAVLSAITYLWHWGQNKKLEYVRDNKILLRDLYEVDPTAMSAPGGKASGGGAGGAVVAWRGLMRPSAASSVPSGDSGAAAGAQPVQALRLVDSKAPVARVPGIGIYYNELLLGVPPVLERFMSLVPALHEVVIFLTVRIVPVPNVLPAERLLLRKLRFNGFYHVVARYGYLDTISHGPEFVEAVVAEIHEYLHPATGIMDLSAELESSAHGGGKFYADVEKGGMGGREEDLEGSVHRGPVVHVDASESLSVVTGRRLQDRMAMQLVNLARPSAAPSGGAAAPTSPSAHKDTKDLSVRSGTHYYSNLRRTSCITVAVPLAQSEGGGEEPWAHGSRPGLPGKQEDPPAPWVQMPSQVRRVRAKLLGKLPEGMPAGASLPASPMRGDTAAEEEANLFSLPLPGDQRRPSAKQLLPHRDSTRSLPLPQTAQQGRRVPLYRLQRALAAAAAASQAPSEQPQQAEQRSGPSSMAEQPAAGVPPLPPASLGSEAAVAPAAAALPPLEADPQLQRRHSRYQATPTATLAPAAAAALGQQLWHRLQVGRLQGLVRVSVDPSESTLAGLPEGEPQALSPGGVAAADAGSHGKAESVRTEDALAVNVAAGMDAGAARRQLFQAQSLAPGSVAERPTESVLEDRFAKERRQLMAARQHGVVYLVGRSNLRAEPGSSWLKRFLLDGAYGVLVANCRSTTRMYQVPREGLLSLGVDYEL